MSAADRPPMPGDRGLVAALCLALAGMVAFAFWPGLQGDWLNWDDHMNFTDNPHYRGLSVETIGWAWTTFRVGVYQPLAWMLFGAQYRLSGMDPWGYHLASLVLHAIAAVVLFLVCLDAGARVRGDEDPVRRRWRTAATALAVALVMVHPFRVEVVAWISCQPYLPCAIFYLLALWAYLRAHPAEGGRRPAWLWLCAAMFIGALLSKAPAVSLPAVLLIFDIWLLGRLPGAPWAWWRRPHRAVLGEKLALAAVAVPFAAAAMAAKLGGDTQLSVAPAQVQTVPLLQLAETLWFYPFKTLVPYHFSPFYSVAAPAPGTGKLHAIAPWATLVALGLMLLRPRSPVTGMALAYVVTLAPNLGFVRISHQLAADRYGFIPTLVVLVMLCSVRWPVPAAGRLSRIAGTAGLALGLAAVPALAALSREYALVWRDSITLWEHALRLSGHRAPGVVSGLGQAYLLAGRFEDSVRAYGMGVNLEPRRAEAHRNLGLALGHTGRLDQAETHLRIAASLDPNLPQIMFNLGEVLYRQQKEVPALAALAMAVARDPGHLGARAMALELLMTTPDLDPRLVTAVREALGGR